MKLPQIITVSCQKGGVGKSTVVINLAAELTKKYPVRIFDLDQQKSALIFNRVREAAGIEPLEVLEIDGVKALQKAVKNHDGITIIDAGGQDSDITRAATRVADMVICPMSDSEIEIYSLLLFNKMLASMKEVRAHVLINRTSSRSSNLPELISQVKAHNKTLSLLNARLSDRSDFRKCFITGKGVTEMKAGAAADEVKKLVKEIEKCLK